MRRRTTDRGPAQVAAADLLAAVPSAAWARLSAGDGAKGPRSYDWVRVPIRPWSDPDHGYWLLGRRTLAEPPDLAYFVGFGPATASLADLVRVAGTRWTIEDAFAAAKGEVGLDHYEVRRWDGWYRHVTLALLAHAYLAVTRHAAVAAWEKGGA